METGTWDDEWDQFVDANYFEAYNNRVLRRERTFRPRLLPFDYYSDEELVNRYRFNRVVLHELCTMLRIQLEHPTKRNYAIPPHTQVLIALRYYATGDHFNTIGDNFGVHKSTVSRCVSTVTNAFLTHAHKFICMPSDNEIAAAQTEFCQKTHLPRIVGAIDGMLIRLMRPVGQLDGPFICRKGYPSINTFAFCDEKRRFRYTQAKFPGSCHDSTILKSTTFFNLFESGRFGNAIVLGDSGYGLRNWLLVPVKFPSTLAQKKYNTLQKMTRVIIEQAFGILKRRFLALHSEMRLQPDKVCKVFTVCAMLHNIAINRGLENFDNLETMQTEPDDNDPAADDHQASTRERVRISVAKRNRDLYIQRHVSPQLANH